MFLTCFWLNLREWKLVPGPFIASLNDNRPRSGHFNSWHLPFLIVPSSHIQKNETLKSWHNWLLSNLSRWLNWKESGTYPQSSKLFKRFLKIIALTYIYQLTKFGDLMSCGSKDIVKNAPCLMYSLWRHRFAKSWDG